jgi:hypothetical protein
VRHATLAVAETGEAKRKGSDVACNIFGGYLSLALLRMTGGAKTACGLSLALRQGQRPLAAGRVGGGVKCVRGVTGWRRRCAAPGAPRLAPGPAGHAINLKLCTQLSTKRTGSLLDAI